MKAFVDNLLNTSKWQRFIIVGPDCEVYTWRNSEKLIDLNLTIYDDKIGAISLECKKEHVELISQMLSLDKLKFIQCRDKRDCINTNNLWQNKYDNLLYQDWERRFTKFFRICDAIEPISLHIKERTAIDLNLKEYELDGSLLKYEKHSFVYSLEIFYLLKTHFYSIFVFKLIMCRYKALNLNRLIVPKFVQLQIFSCLFDNKFEWQEIEDHCRWFSREI